MGRNEDLELIFFQQVQSAQERLYSKEYIGGEKTNLSDEALVYVGIKYLLMLPKHSIERFSNNEIEHIANMFGIDKEILLK